MSLKMNITVACLCVYACLLPAMRVSGQGSDPSSAAVDSNFHIYILMGQSNMAGRGEITRKYEKRGHDRLFMLDKAGRWVSAKHPLHFDKPKIAGVGPGLSFGIEMARARPDVRIGLVPCAVGGTPIDRWQPGAFDEVTGTHPWDDAVRRIRQAKRSGVIKGVLWHQGEGDSRPEKAAVWLKKLVELAGRVREETGDPALPLVAAELGRYRQEYGLINRELARLPDTLGFSAVVSSKGLKHKGDGTHLRSSSSRRLGKRFARAMRALEARRAGTANAPASK